MRLAFALFVAALFVPQAALAVAPSSKGKKSKKKTENDRVVPESAWAAMVDRSVVVISGDDSVHGTLAGHDANTATVIEDNGNLRVVEKDGVSELRAAKATAPAPPPPPPTPTKNSAAAPAAPSDTTRGFKRNGTYVYGSPGAVLFPFSLDLVAYRWGVGVGAFTSKPGSHFARSIGFAFDHAVDHDSVVVATIDPIYGLTSNTDVDVWTHIIRPMAETRLGGSTERVFAYGLIGGGLTVLHLNANESGGASESVTEVGFCAPIGAGVQGFIGERMIVGFEPRVVLDTALTTMFDAKLFIGAKF